MSPLRCLVADSLMITVLFKGAECEFAPDASNLGRECGTPANLKTICGKPNFRWNLFPSLTRLLRMHVASLPGCSTCATERAFVSFKIISDRPWLNGGCILNLIVYSIHFTVADEFNVEILRDVWDDRAAVHMCIFYVVVRFQVFMIPIKSVENVF